MFRFDPFELIHQAIEFRIRDGRTIKDVIAVLVRADLVAQPGDFFEKLALGFALSHYRGTPFQPKLYNSPTAAKRTGTVQRVLMFGWANPTFRKTSVAMRPPSGEAERQETRLQQQIPRPARAAQNTGG
jgi:hypothetical protein